MAKEEMQSAKQHQDKLYSKMSKEERAEAGVLLLCAPAIVVSIKIAESTESRRCMSGGWCWSGWLVE